VAVSLYRDAAIVLRTHKLGEADRIVVLFTRGHGKVRGVAKGVRRTTSKFGSRLEPGSHIQVQLHEGRGELDIVTQAETVEPFRRSREDLSRMTRVSSLLEAIEQLTQDREPAPRLFDMLAGGLRVIEERNPAMVSAAFYLKLLAAEGLAPELDLCVECGEEGGPFWWALEAGGVRCGSCGGGRTVSEAALAVSRAVLSGGLNAVLDLPEDAVTHEVEGLATTALEAHVERRFKALRVMHQG
jgi:DNA repair protein RecO (recombination protein O)